MIGHNLINFDAELWIRQCYKNLIPDVYQIKKLPNRMMDTLNISRASKIINNDSLKCELSATFIIFDFDNKIAIRNNYNFSKYKISNYETKKINLKRIFIHFLGMI